MGYSKLATCDEIIKKVDSNKVRFTLFECNKIEKSYLISHNIISVELKMILVNQNNIFY